VSFTSQIYPGEKIIDDENAHLYATPNEDEFRGLDLGLRGPGEYAYGDAATPFPEKLLLSWSEIEEWIKDMEKHKTRNSDIIYKHKLPHKDQSNTNFCCVNAVVAAVETVRTRQNQRQVILSPASAGAIIKNFRNVGGWGKEAVEFIAQRGLNEVVDWPANAIDRKYATRSNAEKALNYTVSEWYECAPKNLQQMFSALCRGMVGAGGFLWWGHEVMLADPMWLDGEPAMRIRNSWKDWGEFGFGILRGNKMKADDCIMLQSVLAS
jgi:hypothetical protein